MSSFHTPQTRQKRKHNNTSNPVHMFPQRHRRNCKWLSATQCFRSDLYEISSLGVDCHTATSAHIPGQMRLALQSARGIRNHCILDTGKTPRTIEYRVEQAFNPGTIKGARAVGMSGEIGSLTEENLADIVIFGCWKCSRVERYCR